MASARTAHDSRCWCREADHAAPACRVPWLLQTDGGEADPASATRARIESLKLSSKSEAEERAGAEGEAAE